MHRSIAVALTAVSLLLVACSGGGDDSSSSGGSSSGASSSGASNSSSSGGSTTSSGSSSTSKFSCKLNGACYQCPTASAVSKCAKEGPTEAGCTSADDDFCGG
ncbi:MAG: hypothetical protein KF764_09960 [Labilithrix sp.]|nr:hypothetical protein [Labilithrix sp.]MBX3219853.1 hypothetical protein [Labilithrix sp.]